MEGPPLGPGGEDITWPDQVAPRCRKASSTCKVQPQTSNLKPPLDDMDRVPLSEKAPFFNENTPIVGRPQDSGTRRTLYGSDGGANHHKHNPHKLHDLPVLRRLADRVLETAKKTVVGVAGWICTILDMAEISSYEHTPPLPLPGTKWPKTGFCPNG